MAEEPFDVPNDRFAPRTWRKPGSALAAIAVAMLVLSTTMPLGSGAGARAQGRQPTITVPAVISAGTSTETALRIRVSPPGAVPRKSFLRISGLPRTVSLSDGYSIAPGAWAVPLAALPDLRISTPTGAEGRSEVTISLISADGNVLAVARSTLVIGPPGAQEQPGRGQTSTVVKGSRLSPEARRRAMKLLERGNQLIATKDFSAAQHFYKRAADMGLAEAALELAKRYDPHELARVGAVGIMPDREAARKWYERARELGSAEAEDYLRRIDGR